MNSVATISIYEHAWGMYQQGISVDAIAQSINKDRSTIYRWIKSIKQVGIREFLRRKRECKHRRPAARIPEHIIQKIVDIRTEYGWCGQKIQKELNCKYNIYIGLSTIYRWLKKRLEKGFVGIRKYTKHQAIITADAPREVIEHDTVDLGALYAYTAIDIFTKEPSVFIGINLEMETGARAFNYHQDFYHQDLDREAITELTHQSDNGSEFQSDFKAAVLATGAKHRYSRPYKKNEQAHIENFNKALRNECLGKAHYRIDELEEIQLKVSLYTKHYINERWHMGLPDMMTPAQFKQWYNRDPDSAKIALEEVYG